MVERIEDTCIRIRSEMNEWMDCIFIVSEEDAVRAEEVLQEAWDSYWKDGDGWCYRKPQAWSIKVGRLGRIAMQDR